MITVRPDRDALRSFGLAEEHLHIPMIIDPGSGTRPAHAYSTAYDYLRARAGLSGQRITHPPGTDSSAMSRSDSPATTAKVAGALVNLFNYCIRRRVDWRDIQPGHAGQVPSVLHWAFASIEGASGQLKVAPMTAQLQFHYAQHFLWWASANGRRSDYEPVEQKFVRGVRQAPLLDDLVGLPTDDEVRRWLTIASARLKRHTFLMIRLLLECGLRHAEACNIRVRHVPSMAAIERGTEFRGGILSDEGHDLFPMSLTGEDGTKYGRPRTVFLPRPLAESLNAWCRIPKQRPAMVARFKAAHPDQPVPDRLFFNPATGKAYSRNHLNVSGIWLLPTLGRMTSAHRFRHYFASRCMLRMTVRALELHKKISGLATGALLDNALDEGERQLQAQLGHSHPDTTRLYRQWVDSQLAGLRQTRHLKGR